jgi:enoyl-CoA hydratase/carnithine racemase
MNDRVSITIEGGVADVRLTRADKMNALDNAMFEGLIQAGERLKREPGLRAVVLSGDGRAFCAGLDTSNFGAMASGGRSGGQSSAGGGLVTDNRTASGSNRAQHAVMVWREIPVPVIAAVHGVAYGGGYQLQLSADLRFIAPDAKLSVFEIRWGLIPDMAGMALLRGLVRDDVARDLTYSGRIFSGEEALALGLATRVSANPREEALAYAKEVAAKNPHAIRAAKRLLNMADEASKSEILIEESREQVALISSPNQVEAVMANMEKRAPNFADTEVETPAPVPFGAAP